MDGQVRSHRGSGGKSISLGRDYIGCLLIPNATVSISFTFEEFLIGSEKEPQTLDECRNSDVDLRAHDVERLSCLMEMMNFSYVKKMLSWDRVKM